MHTLTAEGRSLVEQVAQRHDVSTDAVMALLRALDRGGGLQAQFSHPDLGGMGQWSRGGMIMVGDMFNNGLKSRVDQLCNELSDLLRTHTMFAPQTSSWDRGSSWPASLGHPSTSGSQNEMSYAWFPETRRLAIQQGGDMRIYDTGDHRIGGVSQQQSGGQDLTFTSQYGTVRLHELALLGAEAPPPQVEPSPARDEAPYGVEPPWSNPPAASAGSDDDIFGKIERLHGLQQKGILSEVEFAEKKKELLARL